MKVALRKYRLTLMPGIDRAAAEDFLERQRGFAGVSGYALTCCGGDAYGEYIATLEGPFRETFTEFDAGMVFSTYFRVTPLGEPGFLRGVMQRAGNGLVRAMAAALNTRL
jgi:hypothetical protein